MIIILIAILSVAFFSIKWVANVLYPLHYKEYIDNYSSEFQVDPLLVASIIKAESKFYKDATSNKGAIGLMQITPSTGSWIASQMGIEEYKVDILYDPETNIMMGCWYIDNLNKQFGNIELVLAAYNGGRGNVKKWLGDTQYSLDGENLYDIPFSETKKYVEKVKQNYKIYKILYDKD
ncbi:MAG: lytic transglycosylase domain-containing protein [Firmicutes bacterium]|nr:lytic transglycosylase domain-containing protein [Bacillota bacterium]